MVLLKFVRFQLIQSKNFTVDSLTAAQQYKGNYVLNGRLRFSRVRLPMALDSQGNNFR